MAEQDTLDAIREVLDRQDSFVVEAGAGSGKTRSLIETVQTILKDQRQDFERTGKQVVCITYTNVAKDEITFRLNSDPLVLVGTIHEFLWQVIAPFQRELRLEVLALNATSRRPVPNLETAMSSVKVTYGKYGRHFDRGELFHDDVIDIAGKLFEKYPKVTRIAADRFPFILVDEYQDTSQTVIDLLLQYFVKNDKKPVVGFFGDSMQQIYDSKITDVAGQNDLKLITKPENYRCSVAVIDVLNRLRTDIQQVPTGNNKPGDIHLLTASQEADGAYQSAMARLADSGWSLENTKILMLTHRGIAREIGFKSLLEAYNKRSFGTELLMEREDEFGELFTYVDELLTSYNSKRFGVFLALLGKTGFMIRTPADKETIANEMDQLIASVESGTVASVIDTITSSTLIPRPRRLTKLQDRIASDPSEDDESFAKKRVFYDAVLEVPWLQVKSFVDYANEHTPFSTKHGVKGAEFENVLVIIDDNLWNQYKFAQVFTNDASNPGRLERSRKLLYVCFSRAMSGLAVLHLGSLSSTELAGLQALLGVKDVTTISS